LGSQHEGRFFDVTVANPTTVTLGECAIFHLETIFECYIPMQHEQDSALTNLKSFPVPGGGHA